MMKFLYFLVATSTFAKEFDVIEYGSPQDIDLFARIFGVTRPNQDFIFKTGCPSSDPYCKTDTLTGSSYLWNR